MVIGGADNTNCVCIGNISRGDHLFHGGTPLERGGGSPGHRSCGGDVEGVYGGGEYPV